MRAVVLKTFIGKLHLFGMYPPSYWGGETTENKLKRHSFHKHVLDLFQILHQRGQTSQLILGGDLNILEPNHQPVISAFEDYYFYESFDKFGLSDAFRLQNGLEIVHSWYEHNGTGQRLDHFFVSGDLTPFITACYYEHEPRLAGLSDHSAMWLIFRNPSLNMGYSAA